MYSFEDLSKYRKPLMGIAIIFIMLYHCHIFPFGYIGVEFFIILSGIGLTFSLETRKQNYLQYVQRRFFRILPLYLIVAIPYFLTKGEDIFRNICFINFFRDGDLRNWFILLIIIFYLAFPAVKKWGAKSWMPLSAAIILIPVCYWWGMRCPNIEIATRRIPICLASVTIGKMAFDKVCISRRMMDSLLAVGLAVWAFIVFGDRIPGIAFTDKTGLLYVCSTILAIPLLLLLTKLIPKLPSVVPALEYLGERTLEIYLTHELIARPLSHTLLTLILPQSLAENLMAIPISIILAIILADALHRLMSILSRNKSGGRQDLSSDCK